jgi:hypothetical protein
MTTSTIPTAAKRKEIVRHGPSTLCVIYTVKVIYYSTFDLQAGTSCSYLVRVVLFTSTLSAI